MSNLFRGNVHIPVYYSPIHAFYRMINQAIFPGISYSYLIIPKYSSITWAPTRLLLRILWLGLEIFSGLCKIIMQFHLA